MKEIDSLKNLINELNGNENIWLLLYKSGSEQSDCAFSNYRAAAEKSKNKLLLYADVNIVRDIHPIFNITSAPSLLHFKNGELANVTKGCQKSEHFSAIFDSTVFVAKTGEDEKPVKRVTVYTTPTCTWCTTVKRHLDHYGVRYREIDVSRDQKAAEEMVRKSGQQGVPQLDINGQVVVGFDRIRINNLLGIN